MQGLSGICYKSIKKRDDDYLIAIKSNKFPRTEFLASIQKLLDVKRREKLEGRKIGKIIVSLNVAQRKTIPRHQIDQICGICEELKVVY